MTLQLDSIFFPLDDGLFKRSTSCCDVPHFDPTFLGIFCISYEVGSTSSVIATLATVATLPLIRFPAAFVVDVYNVLRICTKYTPHEREGVEMSLHLGFKEVNNGEVKAINYSEVGILFHVP